MKENNQELIFQEHDIFDDAQYPKSEEQPKSFYCPCCGSPTPSLIELPKCTKLEIFCADFLFPFLRTFGILTMVYLFIVFLANYLKG